MTLRTLALRGKSLLPVLPVVVATALLAQRCIHAVMAKLGHPGASLDDSFIHFQYARAIAEGHPLRYQAGASITTGATSVLWPALLAPFYLVGFRDLAIMWPAWAMAFTAHGMLCWEAYQLAHPLSGKLAAYGAAAMVLAFGGFAWCSTSGMEVMPFAWAIARATRLAAEWAEKPHQRDAKAMRGLLAMAWVAALFRPEGALCAMFVAATIALYPHANLWRARAWSLIAAAGAMATPLLLLALTGSTRSNTTVVKLMLGNPYFHGSALWQAVSVNARALVWQIWNGEVWSTEFIPTGSAPLAMMALVSLVISGLWAKKQWRAAGVLLLALGMFVPCFYVTFLWNRLRYLWPFATGFFIGLACLSRIVSELAASVWPRAKSFAPIVAGAFAGALAVRLDWTLDDVANSARGIDQQHVKISRWAAHNLAKDAVIGVNDTGAIAYFSDRRTFDIVGLTSEAEASYWVAGAGSRIEHYERLKRTDPKRLPTHFIVYPEWMGTDAVLGKQLFEATVTDSSILGGQSMRAYVADYTLLGSGESPWTPAAEIVDALDVADLDSEASHAYELLGARDGEQSIVKGASAAGNPTLDAGRTARRSERFWLDLQGGGQETLIARLAKAASALGEASIEIEFFMNGATFGTATLQAGDWQETAVRFPSDAKGKTRLEIRSRDGSSFHSFHYWAARQ